MFDRIYIILLTLLTILAGCAQDDNETPRGDAETPQFDFAPLDSEINSFLTANDLAGASVAIVHKDYGIVYEQGYGDFAADRVYLVASSSKVLSAGIIMRLVDQDLLDIDLPISEYLDDWGNYKEDITVAQLLSNSSGMVGLVDDPIYVPYLCQYISTGTLSECAQGIYTADDSADRIPPDTEFHYGGGQWQLAGGIAEIVSGKKWADLVNESYVQPCDATTVGYTNQYQRMYTQNSDSGDIASAVSYPPFFMGDVDNLDPTDNPSIEGGGYASAGDYGKILLMHLRGGLCDDNRVLSEDSVERMQEDRVAMVYDGNTTSETLAGYGLGWWIDRDNPGIVVDGGAYGAMPWLDVERGYGAVVLIEASSTQGRALFPEIKPLIDDVFDQMQLEEE